MKPITQILAFVLTIHLQAACLHSIACSMCKITINGRTYLGNNEDSWRFGSRIWFENKTFGKYGAVYVGYGDGFPQGGMNEAGLAFDGLTVYQKNTKIDPNKTTVSNPAKFIKEIMQTCKTTDDVEKYVIQFNRQAFNASVLLFADKFGNYLVMEPDTILLGNDNKYIIANFCPSTTTAAEKLDCARYNRGEKFLINHKDDTSKSYCLALVDTMHECRKKIGDGTMYSFIADLEKGYFSLYFYHDFSHKKEFHLMEELAKGNHTFEIPNLFPPNTEYKKLATFLTPQNNGVMHVFLIYCSGLFAFSTIFFLVFFFRNKKPISQINNSNFNIKLLLVAVSLVLLYYVRILIKNQAIFYFPSPYQDWRFSLLNIAAYIPFLMLILIVPLIKMNLKILKGSGWNTFSKFLFSINSLTYLTLIVLFVYWKLYSVF